MIAKFNITDYCANPTFENRNRFLKENAAIVSDLINKKFNYPQHIEDLFQEGLLALDHCLTMYSPEKGKFSSYAYRAVSNRMINYLSRSHPVKYSQAETVDIDAPDYVDKLPSPTDVSLHWHDIIDSLSSKDKVAALSIVNKGGRHLTKKEIVVAYKLRSLFRP